MRRWAGWVLFWVSVLVAHPALAQSLELQLQSDGTYAGVPFVLSAVARGFDEEPTPTLDPPEIDGCTVIPLGVSPSVSTRVQWVNGQRSASRDVTFVYRFQIIASRPGILQVPALTATQGGRTARSQPGRIQVADVSASQDMAIELGLPDRPIWIGETVPVTLDWYLAKDVNDHQFVVPLFDQEDVVRVAAAPVEAGERTLTVSAAGLSLELPYTTEQVSRGGKRFTRLRARALLTPLKAGELEVPPTQVVAKLQVGMGHDLFGFPSPRLELRKAMDRPRTLSVHPVPLSGRPDSFAGAVGTGFSIETRASRTVVQVGEPVELTVTIRGHGSLDGLTLPPLSRRDQLDPSLFDLPDTAPVGTTSEDGARSFTLVLRLRSAEVHEIPSLSFSYFDPEDGSFHTAHSQPIALSVAGSAIVGADAVVTAPRRASAPSQPAAGGSPPPSEPLAPLTGADLSLSDPTAPSAPTWTAAQIRPLLVALYGLPPLIFLGVSWRRRHRTHRLEARRLRRLRDKVREAARAARQQPAREAAPPLVAALRALAREEGRMESVASLVERIEVAAYAPSASSEPLDPGLVDEASRRADGPPASPSSSTALLALLALCLLSGVARAEDPADPWSTYKVALSASERQERLDAFARAEAGFAALAAQQPRRAELLVDQGNAALGARHTGAAVLAWRRALALDPNEPRAVRNLDWVRQQLPPGQARSDRGGALQVLLFWSAWLSPPQRALLGGVIFAAMLLLAAPWSDRHRWPRRLALALVVPWLAVLASVWLARAEADDAVVLTASPLRAADSPGAPLVVQEPVHEGAEVDLLESRQGWTRVRLAGGLQGWVRSAAVEPLQP